MTFNGDVEKYVQFITMFRTTFDNVIKDSSSLYNLLTCHMAGSAKQAIFPAFIVPLGLIDMRKPCLS